MTGKGMRQLLLGRKYLPTPQKAFDFVGGSRTKVLSDPCRRGSTYFKYG